MGEVPTNALTFRMCIPRRLARVRVFIPKREVGVYVIANSLNERPSLRDLTESGPGELRETIRLAIPTAEQINERFDGKLFQSMLLSVHRRFVRLAVVADQKIGR